ncbi:unnamed protein product [Adineta steineri]|uniref:Uncharacterized protein n=1 Tax=Adineta steineri TaxID=433720 RepID=A0A815UJ00_9BILA|nr:unnamed protein product [Adineta steineri]CAF4211605.1 unnamed protein product [Adineta steineri]
MEGGLPVSESMKAYFFNDDDDKIYAFWNNQGKVVRGTQRRELLFQENKSLLTFTTINPIINNENAAPTIINNQGKEPTNIGNND